MFEINDTKSVDWQLLRDQGLDYLGSIDNPLWNYFDLKDPGVTILEAACYGIQELMQRLDIDIEDLLAPLDEPEADLKQFFSPREILTVNPLTINDYRKLLIDIEGVRNAWVEVLPTEESVLFLDKDNARRSFHGVSNAEPLPLKGLLKITLEQEDDLYDIAEETLRETVRQRFHAHRNLCEDLTSIDILQPQTAYIFADIEVRKDIDVDEFYAQLYRAIEQFIEPVVPVHSLQSLLQKAYPIEQIFNGPPLENGFIVDDDLQSQTERQELYASDLIRIMMGFAQVKDVHFVSMATNAFAELESRQEWVLPLDKTRVLRLASIQELPLRIIQDGVLVQLNLDKISQKVRLLRQATVDVLDGGERDIGIPFGIAQDLSRFAGVQDKLTENYGLSELGLPFEASAEERANAKQLRAYLLFFDQILANLFAQLGHLKHTLAIEQSAQFEAYNSQTLALSQPETPGKELFSEVRDSSFVASLVNNDERDFERRNRIMSHLLARFNESFADFSLLSLNKRDYLHAKGSLLDNYDLISRERSRGYDYVSNASQPDASANGLQQSISLKLGLSEAEQAGLLIIEHILLRPVHAGSALQFAIFEEDAAQDKLQHSDSGQERSEPYSFYMTCYIANDVGRFRDSANFHELFVQTLHKETPAHIYIRSEQRPVEEITQLRTVYEHFLQQRALFLSGEEHQVQITRRTMVKALGLTLTYLPALHLDGGAELHRNDVNDAGDLRVAQWRDSSVYRQVIDLDAAKRPLVLSAALAGRDLLQFTDQAMSVSAAYSHNQTLALVYKLEPGGGEILSAWQGEPGNGIFIHIQADSVGIITASITPPGTSAITLSAQTNNGIAHFLTLRASYDTRTRQQQWQLTIDGVMMSRRETLPITTYESMALTYVLGQGNIAIGEFLLLDSAMKVELFRALTDYLSEKWGLVASAANSFGTPLVYFDASVEHSFDKTLGGAVSSWTGLSHNAVQAQQALVAQRPTFTYDSVGTLPTLSFRQSQLLLPNPLNNGDGFTLLLVARVSQSGTLFDSIQDSAGLRLRVDDSNRLLLETPANSMALQLADTGMMLILIEKSSGSASIRLTVNGQYAVSQTFNDAAAIASGATELSLGMKLGAEQSASGFGGELAELWIYPQVLEKTRRQALEVILSHKWQIDISGVKPAGVPLLQLDANQLALIEMDQDDGVTVWQDRRAIEETRNDAENYQALQTLSQRRPTYLNVGINGLPALHFDNGKDLSIPRIIEKSFTIFVVYTATGPGQASGHGNWTQGSGLLDADVSGQYNDFGLSVGNNGAVMAGIGERIGHDTTLTSPPLAFGTPHQVCFKRDHALGVIQLRADRALVGQDDLIDKLRLNDTNTLTIGALRNKGASLNGHIGEILVFDSALDGVQVGLVEGYLSGKWGLG